MHSYIGVCMYTFKKCICHLTCENMCVSVALTVQDMLTGYWLQNRSICQINTQLSEQLVYRVRREREVKRARGGQRWKEVRGKERTWGGEKRKKTCILGLGKIMIKKRVKIEAEWCVVILRITSSILIKQFFQTNFCFLSGTVTSRNDHSQLGLVDLSSVTTNPPLINIHEC